ncbi:FMN-binding negative transcriptional regulator [Lentzea sp. NPDC059081]|uniref:FMN-binding negative transcriptional regulator n=1 Tax=Lentzea sp. NPDC059081 TaxID=3346719 RepID=UPI0036C6D8DB
MYTPEEYRAPDPSWTAELVAGNPLALLCSNAGATPHATHLPAIVLGDADAVEPGVVLAGHLNRANPHWSALRTGDEALLVFTGPHGYVSPTVYDNDPAAPTWDFTAVHVRGVLRVVEDSRGTIDVIRATVRALESRFGCDWDMSGSHGYFNELLPGVGAFEVEVTGVQSMFKLSQEQPDELRRRVRRCFAASTAGQHRQLAELIGRVPAAERAATP